MKKTKKKIISMMTSLLMTGSCSSSKAFDNDSYEEYQEDYQDSEEEKDDDDNEDNEYLYDDDGYFIEEKDNLTKAYNWVLNNPYKSLGISLGIVGLGYGFLKFGNGLIDAVQDNGKINLQKYANNLIDSVKKTDEEFKNIPNDNLFTYQKIKIMQEVSKKITANMFREVLPFFNNTLTANLNGAKATAKGVKDVIYSGVRRINKKDLLSHLVSKWNLSKEWACYQCALVLKVVADQLGLPNCICKDKENHVTLLIPAYSPFLYLNGDYQNLENWKFVLRFGGEVNDYFGKPKGVEGKRLYGLNKGDTLFTPLGKVYEVLAKRWKKAKEDKDGPFYLEKGWEAKAYHEVNDIIEGNVTGKTFLKEIDPKKNSYNNLLHNLCMYNKSKPVAN